MPLLQDDPAIVKFPETSTWKVWVSSFVSELFQSLSGKFVIYHYARLGVSSLPRAFQEKTMTPRLLQTVSSLFAAFVIGAMLLLICSRNLFVCNFVVFVTFIEG